MLGTESPGLCKAVCSAPYSTPPNASRRHVLCSVPCSGLALLSWVFLSQRLSEDGRLEARTSSGFALAKMGKEEGVWRELSSSRRAPPSVGLLLYAATWLIVELRAPAGRERKTHGKETSTLEGLKAKFPDGHVTLGHRHSSPAS